MILFDLSNSEQNPAYQALAIFNGDRQFSFLQSIVGAALDTNQAFLSNGILKALNFQAITCLHPSAGEYRPCEVRVGSHEPPMQFRVAALMENFINTVNRDWKQSDPILLGAFILRRLNYIHPFVNGNGRTARAACYFAICARVGGWLPGSPILPARLKLNDEEHLSAIRHADATLGTGSVDLLPLHGLIEKLLREQLASEDAA